MNYFIFWGIAIPNKYILPEEEIEELTEDTDPIHQYRRHELDGLDFRGLTVKTLHQGINGVGRVVDSYFDEDHGQMLVMEIALMDNIKTNYGRNRIDGKLQHIEWIMDGTLSGLSFGQESTFDDSPLDDQIAVYKQLHEVSVTTDPYRVGSNIHGFMWSDKPYSTEFSYDGKGDENMGHYPVTRTTIRNREKDEEERKKQKEENFDFSEHTYIEPIEITEPQSAVKKSTSDNMNPAKALEALTKENAKLKQEKILAEQKLKQEKEANEQMKVVYDKYQQAEREAELKNRQDFVTSVDSTFGRIESIHKQNKELDIATKEDEEIVKNLLASKDQLMTQIKEVYQTDAKEDEETKEVTADQFANAIAMTNGVYAVYQNLNDRNYDATLAARAELYAKGLSKESKSKTTTAPAQGGIKKSSSSISTLSSKGVMFKNFMKNADSLASRTAEIDVTTD